MEINFYDSLDPLGIYSNTFLRDYMHEQISFLHTKERIFGTQGDAKFLALFECLRQVGDMFFIRLAENGDVIQIDNKDFTLFIGEWYVHGLLEGCGLIHQPKQNFCVHEGAPRSGENCLLLVI